MFGEGMRISEMPCAKCGTIGTCMEVPKLQPNISLWALIAGGVVGSLLWVAGRKTDVRCSACDNRFSFRSSKAKICLSIFWVTIGLAAIGILNWTPWT